MGARRQVLVRRVFVTADPPPWDLPSGRTRSFTSPPLASHRRSQAASIARRRSLGPRNEPHSAVSDFVPTRFVMMRGTDSLDQVVAAHDLRYLSTPSIVGALFYGTYTHRACRPSKWRRSIHHFGAPLRQRNTKRRHQVEPLSSEHWIAAAEGEREVPTCNDESEWVRSSRDVLHGFSRRLRDCPIHRKDDVAHIEAARPREGVSWLCHGGDVDSDAAGSVAKGDRPIGFVRVRVWHHDQPGWPTRTDREGRTCGQICGSGGRGKVPKSGLEPAGGLTNCPRPRG